MRFLVNLFFLLLLSYVTTAQTVTVYDLTGNLDFPTWRDWSADQDGNIYGLWSAPIGGENRYTLSRFDEEEWAEQSFQVNCNNCLRALDQHPDGTLWAGTTSGIFSLQNGVWEPEAGVISSVRYLDIAQDGTVWYVDTEGLKKSVDGVITSYTEIDGTPTNSITSLLVDLEGQVYFVQGGSLFRFMGDTLENFGGQAVGVVDITLAADNHLWAALSFGYLLDIFQNEVVIVDNNFISPSGTAGFTAFTIDRAGQFWVATQGGNPMLIRWDGGTETLNFDVSDEFGDFLLVDYIYASPDNRKWLGGNFKETIVEIEDVTNSSSRVDDYGLAFFTPNPVYASHSFIQIELPVTASLELNIINQTGQSVRTQKTDRFSAGSHQLDLNCEGLTPGTYFLQINAGKYNASTKLVIMQP